ncbi:MAG: hypothetical protein ACYC0J_10225 [Gammaproteobacteria bacterium]
MKHYQLLGCAIYLLTTATFAAPDFVVLHNHTNKKVTLTYQADQETSWLVAGPGKSVSNVAAAKHYSITSIKINDDSIQTCDALIFGKAYKGVNLRMSGFNTQITCQAVVND